MPRQKPGAKDPARDVECRVCGGWYNRKSTMRKHFIGLGRYWYNSTNWFTSNRGPIFWKTQNKNEQLAAIQKKVANVPNHSKTTPTR